MVKHTIRVAYLSNQFPTAVEPYVMDEIQELRRCGVEVIPCSARHSNQDSGVLLSFKNQTLYLQPVRLSLLLRAMLLCIRQFRILFDIFKRILLQGGESPSRRARALLHTLLGAYYALLLEEHGVEHIHVHHGYFSSWIAMVAARLLGVSFSMTLHGSDLLIHRTYLDVKLEHCRFCLTVSEFNRRHISVHYPGIRPSTIIVQRLGVDPAVTMSISDTAPNNGLFVMLAVGRLHPVKNHSFLVNACNELKKRGLSFVCLIAGDGPERKPLEQLVVDLKLESHVRLLGHLSRERLGSLYEQSNLVVLTSHSEGIPLVLMEAMVRRRTVLAPDITGIPELIDDSKTGFLYRPASLEHFVEQVQFIHAQPDLASVRDAGRQHVLKHFNREKNLAAFSQLFIERIFADSERTNYENPLLQQVQLSLQRH